MAYDPPFRFMDMPRELRDLIYDKFKRDFDLGDPILGLSAWQSRLVSADMTSGPQASLLRVSKKFSAEYREYVKRTAAVVIEDRHLYPELIDWTSSLHEPLKHINKVQLCVWRRGNDALLTERVVRRWVSRLQSLSGDSLQIKLILKLCGADGDHYFPNVNGSDPIWKAISAYTLPGGCGNADRRPDQGLDGLAGVESVEVRYTRHNPCEALKEGPIPSRYKVYGTWTIGQGWRSGKLEEG